MDLDTFFTTVYVLIGQTHQNQRIVVSRSERACRGDHTGSPVLFMAGRGHCSSPTSILDP